MSDEKLKHLEFIQNVITRMNTNSFQIKSWIVTIITALLAIYASTGNTHFVIISIFPVFVFWFLDSYYLLQERKFIALYNDVAGISESPKLLKPFDMRPDLYTTGKCRFRNVLFSITLIKFYASLILLLVVSFVVLLLYC